MQNRNQLFNKEFMNEIRRTYFECTDEHLKVKDKKMLDKVADNCIKDLYVIKKFSQFMATLQLRIAPIKGAPNIS